MWKRVSNRLGAVLAAALLVALAAGCGYTWRDQTPAFGSDVRKVFVGLAGDVSTSQHLAPRLIQEIRALTAATGYFTLTNRAEAERIIEVSITTYIVEGATLSTIEDTASRRLIIGIEARAVPAGGGETVWRSGRIEARRTFLTASTQAATEANERAAIDKLSQDLAEQLHNRLFQGF